MQNNTLSTLEENLQDLYQNAYDVLGDMIAVECYQPLQKKYPADVLNTYANRLCDYMQQHAAQTLDAAALVRRQIESLA